MPTIGFIGGGNMASSLIGGLINSGYPAADITVIEPNTSAREKLLTEFGVNSVEDTTNFAYDICILSVKPQILKTVCQQLVGQDINNTLFISVAAGIKSTSINRWLSNDNTASDYAIVRCMPNTPALLQCGATGLFANEQVSENQKQQAEDILKAVGLSIWVDSEEQLNAVTAVSGSGPAYFFLLMEAMQASGEKLGLSSEVAQQLVLQTALGAARMAIESTDDPASLRKNVTSKGGTTEQAILSFQSADFENIVAKALQAASDRSVSLANELDSE